MYLSEVDVRIRLYAGYHLYEMEDCYECYVNYRDSAHEVLSRVSSKLSTEFERHGKEGDFSSITITGDDIEQYLTAHSQAIDAIKKLDAFTEDLARLGEEELPPEYGSGIERLIETLQSGITSFNSLVDNIDTIVVQQRKRLRVRKNGLEAYQQVREETIELMTGTHRYFIEFDDILLSIMPELKYEYQQAIESTIEEDQYSPTTVGIEDIVKNIKSKEYIQTEEKEHISPEEQSEVVAAGDESSDNQDSSHEATDPLQEGTVALDLPVTTHKSAEALSDRLQRQELPQGIAEEELRCAVLYIACRQNGVPRSPDDFAVEIGIDKGDILNAVDAITELLDISLLPAHPLPFVDRFADELELDEKTKAVAKDVANYVVTNGRASGYPPASIAAAVVYAASKHTGTKITQKRITTISDVSPVSIRNQYQEYLEIAEEINSDAYP